MPARARGNADNVPFIGRSDPKGNPVRLAKVTGHVSNYSEDKIRPYSLPDPLVMASGERVASADQSFKVRRPEILKYYRDEIYGRVPANAPKVTWVVSETDAAARGGTAIMKRVVGQMGDKPDGPKMTLTVQLPAKASEPVPVLLSISFGFPPGRTRAGRGQDWTATAYVACKGRGGKRAWPGRVRCRERGARPRLGLRLAELW